MKLNGCQRPSCAGSFQWKQSYGSPYTDKDFVYEGYKTVKFCVSYMNGTGCKDGNKCLDSHRCKWDEKLPEKKIDAMSVDCKERKKESIEDQLTK